PRGRARRAGAVLGGGEVAAPIAGDTSNAATAIVGSMTFKLDFMSHLTFAAGVPPRQLRRLPCRARLRAITTLCARITCLHQFNAHRCDSATYLAAEYFCA